MKHVMKCILILITILLFAVNINAAKLYDMGDPAGGADPVNDWFHMYDMSVGPTGTSVKMNINDMFTAYLLGQTITTQYALVVFDGSGAFAETNVLIDSSGNVTGATSYATDKVSGVPGRFGAHEGNSTDVFITGNEGAANIAASLWFKYSNIEPTANGIMLHGVPAAGISQRSWGYFDEVTIEVSAGTIQIKDGGVGLEKLTSITPPPIVLAEPDQLQPIDDAWPIMQFLAETYPSGVIITSIHISTSATCTDVLNFEEWSNNGTSWSVDSTVENITLSGTHTEDDGSLADGSIAADAWLYVDLPASPTDIAYYSIVISFTVN